jgi:hypothetical protein
MIRHIVLFKARAEVTEDHIAKIFADLHDLTLPGIIAIHSGRSESPEQIERGYLHGFTVDFSDWEALAAYQVHPDHQRVGGALVAAAQGGIDGILVFDLPMKVKP